MFYLARVYQEPEPSEGFSLHLLAQQQSDALWTVISVEKTLHLSVVPPELGSLVLVETNNNLITSIKDATEWVVEIVRDYLTIGMTPQMLQDEAAEAEKFRQELTIQSRELDRKIIELEARLYRSQER